VPALASIHLFTNLFKEALVDIHEEHIRPHFALDHLRLADDDCIELLRGVVRAAVGGEAHIKDGFVVVWRVEDREYVDVLHGDVEHRGEPLLEDVLLANAELVRGDELLGAYAKEANRARLHHGLLRDFLDRHVDRRLGKVLRYLSACNAPTARAMSTRDPGAALTLRGTRA
jgi:hypothetical protein